MKKITVWSRLIQDKNKETGNPNPPRYVHNHIEDDWVPDAYPKPKDPKLKDQNAWKNYQWSKDFRFLGDDFIII